MKFDTRLCLLLLVAVAAVAARKGKQGKRKDRKSAPQWKSSSMPAMDKRFESKSEGKDLKLDCKAQGHPRPSVSWYKDGVKIMDGDKMEVKKFALSLKSLTADMSGNYTCLVSNKHGQLEWTFHLDVQAKLWPLIVEGPDSVTQMAGSTVIFRCRVLNDPQATIRWQRGIGQYVDITSPQPEFLPDGDDPGILVLRNISKEDGGEYKCMAGNVWGLKFSTAVLTVVEPVLVPQVPTVSETDKKDNNAAEPDFPNGRFPFDPKEPSGRGTGRDPFYTGGYNPEGANPDEFGPDLYYTTTRRPRKNGRRKNKKNKKGKDKNRFGLESEKDTDENMIMMKTTTTTTTTTTEPPTEPNRERSKDRTTYPDIWSYNDNENDYKGIADGRYKPVSTNKDERAQPTSESPKGSISSWTIYTIVGAVSGVILLVGLVAITLTLCCKREEGGVYKSTPV